MKYVFFIVSIALCMLTPRVLLAASEATSFLCLAQRDSVLHIYYGQDSQGEREYSALSLDDSLNAVSTIDYELSKPAMYFGNILITHEDLFPYLRAEGIVEPEMTVSSFRHSVVPTPVLSQLAVIRGGNQSYWTVSAQFENPNLTSPDLVNEFVVRVLKLPMISHPSAIRVVAFDASQGQLYLRIGAMDNGSIGSRVWNLYCYDIESERYRLIYSSSYMPVGYAYLTETIYLQHEVTKELAICKGFKSMSNIELPFPLARVDYVYELSEETTLVFSGSSAVAVDRASCKVKKTISLMGPHPLKALDK